MFFAVFLCAKESPCAERRAFQLIQTPCGAQVALPSHHLRDPLAQASESLTAECDRSYFILEAISLSRLPLCPHFSIESSAVLLFALLRLVRGDRSVNGKPHFATLLQEQSIRFLVVVLDSPLQDGFLDGFFEHTNRSTRSQVEGRHDVFP